MGEDSAVAAHTAQGVEQVEEEEGEQGGEETEEDAELRALLSARLSDPLELQPARKLAASLLGRMPHAATLPAMLDELRDAAAAPLAAARRPEASLALYYACVACSLQPGAARAAARAPGVLQAIAALACWRDRAVETRQLQAGGADLLTRLLCAEVERDAALRGEAPPPRKGRDETPRAAPLVIEIVTGGAAAEEEAEEEAGHALTAPTAAAASPDEEAALVRGHVLGLLGDSADADAALHVLVMAAQLQKARGGADAAARLAQWAVPPLLAMPPDHRATHALFELAFHAQPLLPCRMLHGLLRRALDDVRSRAAERRLAGLKLLGVVLSAGGDTEVWGDRPDALIAETLDLLRSLAAIDESVGVRQLASSLHETLFKGAT